MIRYTAGVSVALVVMVGLGLWTDIQLLHKDIDWLYSGILGAIFLYLPFLLALTLVTAMFRIVPRLSTAKKPMYGFAALFLVSLLGLTITGDAKWGFVESFLAGTFFYYLVMSLTRRRSHYLLACTTPIAFLLVFVLR
ncbi:hypothetical protein JJB07_01460 [Tumebacillus sp. ITR2]|uniref:Tripartite tricarboxylate transporter TctB family protein n=1 Tax=Tumebacillus amylolyticus TaxID=2801339 RepID=A0ABS1J4V1_9BACL|nr:hypothetical protein [Tumebacillus amylolyticus]MBL0385300.1 hypothetical protein [Tumebacillus amylolyticus]